MAFICSKFILRRIKLLGVVFLLATCLPSEGAVLCHQVLSDLSQAEIEGIRAVTDLDAYWYINRNLRSSWRRFLPSIKVANIDSGLSKLSKFKGIVFRGSKLPVAIYNRLQERNIFSDPGYIASTTSLEMASNFTTKLSDLDGIVNVMFVIKSTSGRNITQYSTYGAKESEILFARNTKFMVEKIEFNVYHWVYLKELNF